MPGPFLTDISKAWDMSEFNAKAETDIALQRGGEADEIVGAAPISQAQHLVTPPEPSLKSMAAPVGQLASSHEDTTIRRHNNGVGL